MVHTILPQAAAVLRFTMKGDGLMAYTTGNLAEGGTDVKPVLVQLLDAPTLAPRWQVKLADIRHGYYPNPVVQPVDMYQPDAGRFAFPVVVFSPVADMLYIVHADADRLTSVDFERASARTLDIHRPLSFFERLLSLTASPVYAKMGTGTNKFGVLSKDGKTIYLVGQAMQAVKDASGQFQENQTYLGLQVVRPTDAALIGHIETQATEIDITPDGAVLLLCGNDPDAITYVPWTAFVDRASLHTIKKLNGEHVAPARRLDGRPIFLTEILPGNNTSILGALDPIICIERIIIRLSK